MNYLLYVRDRSKYLDKVLGGSTLSLLNLTIHSEQKNPQSNSFKLNLGCSIPIFGLVLFQLSNFVEQRMTDPSKLLQTDHLD